MIVYFDSSALLKLLLDEPDAEVALEVWNQAELVATSDISYLEVRAGLARAVRQNPPKLSSTGYEDAKRKFDELWSEVIPLDVTTDLIARASEVAESYALRGYDALQFAALLEIVDDEVVLATSDQELERAAQAAGVQLTRLSPSQSQAS